MIQNLLILGLCLIAFSAGSSAHTDDNDRMHPKVSFPQSSGKQYEDASYWKKNARDTLAKKLKEPIIETEAKNTVFFLGDGMSLPTVTAARIYKGQLEKLEYGEEASLFFESFPNTAISKTFCSDSQTADSACSATAYLTGVKANIYTIGVKPTVNLGNCEAQMNVTNQVESVLAWAQAAGKSTGIITTTRITHASPSGTYAHIAHRDWENDDMVRKSGQNPDTCDDIAEQLILRRPGINVNVILGGGRREFTPTSVIDPEEKIGGKRTDNKNLIEIWKVLKSGKKAQYVSTRAEFEKIDPKETDFVLGLFNYDHLSYHLDSTEDPSLPELTKKAIEILSRNPKGYFLFVEGGRIDHAHHDNMAQKALMETVMMDKAVETAANMTSENDTLILVTADHAHVFSISGYPKRGNPIMGTAGTSDKDNLPYTTLSYANGPGYKRPTSTGERYDISNDDTSHKDYKQPTGLPVYSETHGGDDVAIFSRGPYSHYLSGVVHQNYIPHLIGYASCTGSGLRSCSSK
ncbi:unnamed protein product [Allacma fusca]|uniref:alkaline phosphatase n=1 Tax=Allacma fusca TaxID=39272 RepID=A0A8J2JKC0_9HEXA|nr:unnamed protein product [Allacma fusca]